MHDVELARLKGFLRLRGQTNGRGMAPDTVDELLKVLRRAERLGLDVARFTQSAAIAQDEGDAFLLPQLEQLDRRDDGKGRNGYNNYVQLLKALARWQRFDRDVVFTFIETEEPENKALSDEEIAAIMAWTHRQFEPRLRGRALIHFELGLGWRSGEVVETEEPHMRPQPSCPWQPSVRDPSLREPPGDEPYTYCAKPRKKGKRRWVPHPLEFYSPHRPLVPWLRFRPICTYHPLRIWTNSRVRGRCKCVDAERHGENADCRLPVETADRSRPPCICMGPADVRKTLRTIGRESGLVELNARRLRHTCGTLWYEDGVKPLAIKQRLGHNSLDSTEVYMQVRTGYDLSFVSKQRSLYGRKSESHEGEVPDSA